MREWLIEHGWDLFIVLTVPTISAITVASQQGVLLGLVAWVAMVVICVIVLRYLERR